MSQNDANEEAAWSKFWEGVDNLREVLTRRNMEFTVQWAMTSRKGAKPSQAAPSSSSPSTGGDEGA